MLLPTQQAEIMGVERKNKEAFTMRELDKSAAIWQIIDKINEIIRELDDLKQTKLK